MCAQRTSGPPISGSTGRLPVRDRIHRRLAWPDGAGPLGAQRPGEARQSYSCGARTVAGRDGGQIEPLARCSCTSRHIGYNIQFGPRTCERRVHYGLAAPLARRRRSIYAAALFANACWGARASRAANQRDAQTWQYARDKWSGSRGRRAKLESHFRREIWTTLGGRWTANALCCEPLSSDMASIC